jgi:hypothetical protein
MWQLNLILFLSITFKKSIIDRKAYQLDLKDENFCVPFIFDVFLSYDCTSGSQPF